MRCLGGDYIMKHYVFIFKANLSAGSQDQDEPNLYENFGLPIQEVSDYVCRNRGSKM